MPQKTIRLTQILGILALIMTTVSCSSSRDVSRVDVPEKNVGISSSFKEYYARIAHPLNDLQTVDGDADVWIKTPQEDRSLSCNIRVKREKGIQIVGSVFFGFTVVEAFIRPDSIFVHNMYNKQLLVGQNSEQNVRKTLGLSANFDQMTDVFLGIPSLPQTTDKVTEVRSGKGMLGVVFKYENYSRVVVIDSVKSLVESVQLYDAENKPKGVVNYRDYELVSVNGKKEMLPKTIELVSYQPTSGKEVETRQVIVSYSDREINKPSFAFDFKVPKRTSVVHIEQMSTLVR